MESIDYMGKLDVSGIGWQLGNESSRCFLVCIELVDVSLHVWVPYGGGILQYVTYERVLLMFESVTQPTST